MKSTVFRVLVAAIVCFSVCACSGPDAFTPQVPWRDSYPVQELWILENMSETVSVVNLDRWQSGKTPYTASAFLAGRVPNYITVYEDKGYIVNSEGNSLTVFSLRYPETRYEISLGQNMNPWAVALVRQGSVLRALVTCFLDNSLAVVRVEANSGTLERVIALTNGSRPEGIALSASRAYIAQTGYNFDTFGYDNCCITMVDISSSDPNAWQEAGSIPAFANPQALAFDSTRNELFALSTGAWDGTGGELAVFDADLSVKKRSWALPAGAQALVLDVIGGRVFAAGDDFAGGSFINCYVSDTLMPNPSYTFAQLPANSSPSALALDASGSFLFAADFGNYPNYTGRVLAFDLTTDTLAGIFPCGFGPQSLVCVTVH